MAGPWEAPPLLATLRERDDLPLLANWMHLTGAGTCGSGEIASETLNQVLGVCPSSHDFPCLPPFPLLAHVTQSRAFCRVSREPSAGTAHLGFTACTLRVTWYRAAWDECLCVCTVAGVEVGVDSGVFSKHVLATWKGAMWHLVDPWEAGGGYVADRSAQYHATMQNVEAFPGRYTVHVGYSTVVALVSEGGCHPHGRSVQQTTDNRQQTTDNRQQTTDNRRLCVWMGVRGSSGSSRKERDSERARE